MDMITLDNSGHDVTFGLPGVFSRLYFCFLFYLCPLPPGITPLTLPHRQQPLFLSVCSLAWCLLLFGVCEFLTCTNGWCLTFYSVSYFFRLHYLF